MERLWRPAAQRNVRNVWSSIDAARSSWTAASSKGLAAATGFVNAFLTQGYFTSTMDLGVLKDIPGLESASIKKLLYQQRSYLEELVSSYNELEDVVSSLIHAAKSMRTYVKTSGSVATFSSDKVLDDDNGDGNGAPVFSMINIKCYEDLASEIAAMYVRELRLKWRIASKLLQVGDQETLSTEKLIALHETISCQHELPLPEDCSDPSRDLLEIWLTSWLAEAKIDRNRLDEIITMVNGEIMKERG